MGLEIYKYKKQLKLENAKKLKNFEIAYHTYGTLNEKKDNVIWVSHALTANSDVFEWWKGLFGENELFNPEDYFIVCPNILASHYGTTGPLSTNPATGQPYFLSFPHFTIRDMVQVHKLLADHLGINEVNTLIGGSLGGQQALEWAILEPVRIKKLILMATNAYHSPWGIAFNESQRLAIASDRTFYAGATNGGVKGMKVARSIALLSYRSYETYNITQREVINDKTDNYRASSYQNYQGEKLAKRFNAYSYWYLTKAMDSHNVGRDRGSVEEALVRILADTLVLGITSDVLFPPAEQKFLAEHIPSASYLEITSIFGHDGFLIETEVLSNEIATFLRRSVRDKISLPLQKIA